ncbi:hypothetical protein [uncultured Cohaesibacter sp.]|uniref:hypothetical protein n=1 Tax=uncultured Cohaesibacter sp. TaxID=1002546 RepID=UPI0029C6F198|nr:hypothetical protein [uncultured Cohaesibacter sp.]
MALSAEIKDLLYIAGLVAAVSGSHFMTRAKIMVLEERMKGYGRTTDRIFDTLERIEKKLDDKADK